jgi:hypothetical protein
MQQAPCLPLRYAFPRVSKKRALVAVALLLVVAIAAYWGWSQYRKSTQQRAISAALQDTTTRLRDSLAVAPSAAGKRSLPRIEEHVAAVDAHLKLVQASRANAELADGAEHYVLGAREILRRQAASIRQSEQSAAARAALVAHMRSAARRDGAWIRDAMAQKKTVEAQYFDYGVTLKALAQLLYTFHDSRKRVEPHVDSKVLLEVGPAEDARRIVLKESQRAAQDLEAVRRLR